MKLKIWNPGRHPYWTLLFVSVILTLGYGALFYLIGDAHSKNHPFFFDVVSYAFMNAKLWVRLETEGQISLIINEWLNNDRQPFRTSFLLALWPKLLSMRMGHLPFNLASVFAFLFTMGGTVYKRSGSLRYSISCLLLFFTVHGFYSPVYGLAPNWLDMPSALWMGAAICCLLNAMDSSRLGWISCFALFYSISFLSRFPAGIYGLYMCGPLFLFYSYIRLRNFKSDFRLAWLPILLPIALFIIFSGYFAIRHGLEVIQFYQSFGFDLKKGILPSMQFILTSIPNYFGWATLLVFISLAFFNYFLGIKTAGRSLVFALTFLPGISHLLFMGGITQVTAHVGTLAWSFPPLMLLAMAPISGRFLTGKKGLTNVLSIILLFFSLYQSGKSFRIKYYSALHPSVDNMEKKKFDKNLGSLVSQSGEKVVWNAYFAEHAWIPSMESFYSTGILPLPAGQDFFFTEHYAMWVGNYGEIPFEAVALDSYRNTAKWVDLAIIFRHSDSARSHFNNKYTKYVSAYYSEKMPSDPSWEKVFSMESNQYGTLDGYRNRTLFPGQSYGRLLLGNPVIEGNR